MHSEKFRRSIPTARDGWSSKSEKFKVTFQNRDSISRSPPLCAESKEHQLPLMPLTPVNNRVNEIVVNEYYTLVCVNKQLWEMENSKLVPPSSVYEALTGVTIKQMTISASVI